MTPHSSPPSLPVASDATAFPSVGDVVTDHDPLQAAASALLDGKTPRQYAQAPCEHGMRYRGTGRSCGYCLAMADIAEGAVALARSRAAGKPWSARCDLSKHSYAPEDWRRAPYSTCPKCGLPSTTDRAFADGCSLYFCAPCDQEWDSPAGGAS